MIQEQCLVNTKVLNEFVCVCMHMLLSCDQMHFKIRYGGKVVSLTFPHIVRTRYNSRNTICTSFIPAINYPFSASNRVKRMSKLTLPLLQLHVSGPREEEEKRITI